MSNIYRHAGRPHRPTGDSVQGLCRFLSRGVTRKFREDSGCVWGQEIG